MRHIDVVIVGAGPAGIACAIQLKRLGVEFLLVDKNKPGGLLHQAGKIANYPGYYQAVTSSKLIGDFLRHLDTYNIKVEKAEVSGVRESNGIIAMALNNATSFEPELVTSRILVVASGTRPITQNLHKPDSARVLYDVSRLRNKSGKQVAFVGAGDAAFDYALQLAGKHYITVFNRSNRIRALHVLKEEFFRNHEITYHENFELQSIRESVNNLTLTFMNSGREQVLLYDYLIFATGREPELELFSDGVKDALDQFIKEKRIYIIGDAANGRCRQTAIAVGDGVKAGMEIGGM
ncbi:MAG: NAD(P)/FAD-dependent oxidoreductase [Bacteroidetes bacterium]|nr:NAD(P)/FAD-dependent oxidoreductase [Bacteroidota bacterium]